MPALDREQRNATQRAYVERNKERVYARQKEYQKEYSAANRDKINAYRRDWREKTKRADMLRYKYNVTPEWYEETLAAQGGTCAYPLCTKTEETGGKALAVDHDHETGKVRGIMCTFHNTKLIDREFHRWAIEYLSN